jgi:hypothetical protein
LVDRVEKKGVDMSQEIGNTQNQVVTGVATVENILMPAPTAWPMALALGIALLIGGLLTHWVVSVLGVALAVLAATGWFFQVVPHEHHIALSAPVVTLKISSARLTRQYLSPGVNDRKILPIETFTITSGIRGGLVGGAAMILPAALFGLVRYHSIWYAANLLAAGGFVSWSGASDAFLAQFHLVGLLAALGIHGLASVLFGLLYGAMLPMFPRLPILTAGFVAPLMWTGILHSALAIISPILNTRIDWLWFVVSQVAFGLVCGFVVNLHAKVRTPQFRALPFAVRAGIAGDENDERGGSR